MNFSLTAYSVMAAMLVFVVYQFGHQQGMIDAPETVAYETARDAIEDMQWAAEMAAYDDSPGATCDQIFELVLDDMNETARARSE